MTRIRTSGARPSCIRKVELFFHFIKSVRRSVKPILGCHAVPLTVSDGQETVRLLKCSDGEVKSAADAVWLPGNVQRGT